MNLSLIVLTSFYPPAQQALEYADTLAQAVGGRLLLLHAKRVSFFDPYVFVGEAWHQQELKEEADTKTLLEHRAGQLRSAAAVVMETDLLPERARTLATQNQPALFVLGRPGPDKISFEHLGPMAIELLRVVQLPLLLVPLAAPRRGLPRRVVVAADEEEFTLPSEHAAVPQLLGSLGAELTVAHVSALEDDEGCARAMHAVQHSGLIAGLPEPALRGYQAQRPAEGVLAAIEDTQADLVVMLARPRSYLGELFHKSVTASVISQSPVPVLVVPATVPTDAPHKEPRHRNQGNDLMLWPVA